MMENQKKYFFKVAVLAVLSFALMRLKVRDVSNLRDFLAGLAMGAIIVIVLELVYSVIRSLCENEKKL